MGAVHNPNNHNPFGQNPNTKIPTKTHKLRQKLTFYILVANINFLLSQFNLI